MPATWHVCGLRQSHMQRSSKRSGRINKVHRIQDLWWRPIDQLGADCLRHSEVPMGIITKSELRQNYCITEDKLQHFTLTITVAPFQRLMCVDKDKVRVMQRCLLMEKVTLFCLHKSNKMWFYVVFSHILFKCYKPKLDLKASITHQSWKKTLSGNLSTSNTHIKYVIIGLCCIILIPWFQFCDAL